jgi:hypothetical protein
MRGHFRCLSDNRRVHIAHFPALALYQGQDVAQQCTAVSTFELRIGVRKMFTYITQCGGAKQCIAQGMQENITIGMSEQAEPVRNANATQGDEIAFSETVHIIAMANTHKKTP